MAAGQWPRDRVGCSGKPWRWSPPLLQVGSDRGVHYPVGLEFPGQRGEIPGDGDRAGAASLLLDNRVVVGIRVDVVGDEPPIFSLDELEARYPDAPEATELQVAVDDRIPETLTPVEQAPCCLYVSRAQPETRAGVVTFVGRAELEPGAGVSGEGIEELAADDLDPCDVAPDRIQVFLQQRDPVNRMLVVVPVYVVVEVRQGVETPHSEALATLIVLGDEREGHAPRPYLQVVPADHRDGGRDVEPERPQCRVLVDLAHLQFHDPSPVYDEAAVTLQPAQDRPGVVLGCNVAPRVRRSTHPGVEDALWWNGIQVERTLDQVPLLPRHSLGVECRCEGW